MTVRVRYAPQLLAGRTAPWGMAGAVPQASQGFAQSGYLPAVQRRADPCALQGLQGQTMGTSWSVRLANPQFLPLEAAQQAIEQALAQVVAQMSHWEKDSDISRFNRAPAGSWQVLPDALWTVLDCALAWAQDSGGAWDPTVGPLVDAWGFGPRANTADYAGAPPDAAVLAQAQARVGYQRLQRRLAQQSVLQPGAVHLDLSGIAKGYAVDLVAQQLQALGHANFLVEIGGELRACGQRPDGLPWRVAVAGTPHQLVLHNTAIATSGDHWHVFEHAGQRYSHSLDPRSGAPVAHGLSSVTVVHEQCMQADALATVLTVLGPQEGLDFAQARGLSALLVSHSAQGPELAMTRAFAALLA